MEVLHAVKFEDIEELNIFLSEMNGKDIVSVEEKNYGFGFGYFVVYKYDNTK